MKIQNDQIKAIVDGADKTDASSIQQINFLRKVTVSGLSMGQTTIIPVNNGGSTNVRYIPQFARVRLVSITGALLTGAILRIGNNGSFDNISALTTLTSLSTANVLLPMTLAATLSSIDLSSSAIVVDVQTAATGTVLTDYQIEVQLFGMIQ